MEGFFGVVLGYGISIWVIVKIVKFITRLFSDSDSIGNKLYDILCTAFVCSYIKRFFNNNQCGSGFCGNGKAISR